VLERLWKGSSKENLIIWNETAYSDFPVKPWKRTWRRSFDSRRKGKTGLVGGMRSRLWSLVGDVVEKRGNF
jgi:hypothetical protein